MRLTLLLMLWSVASAFAQTSVREALQKPPGRYELNPTIGPEGAHHLPVVVFKGKQEGVVMAVVSGVHGYEYPPIVAVGELIGEIDVSRVSGAIIVVPVANLPSFFARTPFVSPTDGLNLNKSFPGDPSGSLTQQIASVITTEIIANADIFLDIHAGDASEDLLPFVCYYNNPGNQRETTLAARLCEASGFENVVSYPYHLKKTDKAEYAFKQAVQAGKVGLSIEAGKLGNVQRQAVDLIKQGVYGILDDAEIYQSQNKMSFESRRYFSNQAYVKSEVTGVFHSTLKAGDRVKKGQALGFVSNVLGNRLEEFVSPSDGIILYKIGTPPVNKGETAFCIGLE